MTNSTEMTNGDVHTWVTLFERAPPAVSEATVRETLAARRRSED